MIFCVEDDNNIRDLLVYTLETTGFHARGLEDSQELWKALAEEEPELILLDIMLPGEDGYSILVMISLWSLPARNLNFFCILWKTEESL